MGERTVGRRGRESRSARVWAWVAEGAERLETPVSVALVCDTAADRLGFTGAVMTVDAGGWPEVKYSTDDLGRRLVELHVTVGEGPCADALAGPVLVADLDAESALHRWPLFAPLAVQAGARALFALPLRIGAIRAGTLALHRVEAGPLAPEALVDLLAFARLALGLLLDEQARLHDDGRDPADGLPLHNPQLHQATGMVAAQLGIGVRDAFARLRARAFAEQRPLAVLAADVVSRQVRFHTQEDVT